MKSIIFYIKHKPSPATRLSFALRMLLRGVKVSYCKEDAAVNYDTGNLYVTDSEISYSRILKAGGKALAVVEEGASGTDFAGAEYLCSDVFKAEFKYFDEVWHRFNDLPMTILKTRRLILRETVEADVDSFYEMYKDPRITEFTEGLYDNPEEEKEYVRQYREKVYKVSIFGIYTVIGKKDGAIIGRVGTTIRDGFDEVEVGFVIGTAYQRKGYAFEAMKAILKRMDGFGEKKRFALVMPGNISSQKLLAKLSFAKVDEITVGGIRYGLWKD
ncbi:MAG: GNAT family N-acetyltransferase [Lachnospiraceae bacterium]|nr:GNAT family N-acetyltransferase [Lachnospiraceae bacterium]